MNNFDTFVWKDGLIPKIYNFRASGSTISINIKKTL